MKLQDRIQDPPWRTPLVTPVAAPAADGGWGGPAILHLLTATAVALLLFAGCGRAPARLDPVVDLEVPESWSAGPTTAAESTLAWWSTFGVGPLDSLVSEALLHNHDLRAAIARIDAASAQARIAGADALPTLNAGASAARERRSLIGIPLPADRDPTSTNNRVGVALDTSWELDLWGRIRNSKGAALADVQASWADAHAAQNSLAGQTAKAFFSLAEANLQVELAEATVRSYRSTADRIRDRYERGLRSSLDLRLALSSLASAEALLELRRTQMDLAARQLETLLGRYPRATITAAASLPSIPPAPPTGLPGTLVSRRPDLVAAERRLAASGARVRESQRALLPRLSLSGSAGSSSEKIEDLLDGNFFVWNLMGNLTQPLFQGGRLRAGVQLANATAAQAFENYASTLLAAYREVETALASEQFLAAQERAQAEAALQARAAERLAQDRYRNGLKSFVTVLESQRSALVAQSLLLAVQRQRLDVRVNLHLALGGGFELVEDADGRIQLDGQSSTLNASP